MKSNSSTARSLIASAALYCLLSAESVSTQTINQTIDQTINEDSQTMSHFAIVGVFALAAAGTVATLANYCSKSKRISRNMKHNAEYLKDVESFKSSLDNLNITISDLRDTGFEVDEQSIALLEASEGATSEKTTRGTTKKHDIETGNSNPQALNKGVREDSSSAAASASGISVIDTKKADFVEGVSHGVNRITKNLRKGFDNPDTGGEVSSSEKSSPRLGWLAKGSPQAPAADAKNNSVDAKKNSGDDEKSDVFSAPGHGSR